MLASFEDARAGAESPSARRGWSLATPMCNSQGPELRKARQRKMAKMAGDWTLRYAKNGRRPGDLRLENTRAAERATVTFSTSARGSRPLLGNEPLEVTFTGDAHQHTRDPHPVDHTQCPSVHPDTGSIPHCGTPDTHVPQASLSLYKSQDCRYQKAFTQVGENQLLPSVCPLSERKQIFEKFLMCVAQQRGNSITAFR